ncbi:hypothetical protein OIU77_007422 [Salix suchowensis]|uniref:Uncharacterized protein n=1 Tax=Salix suchowensis TaxID=1278906 RepID=A0ABQ9AH84_9ROSI|nr:hypothetical protein OIU77_007422 [Salix suchowensis]
MEEAKRDEEESKQQQIWSWGAGTEGQLGTGKLEDEYLPQLLHLPFLSSAGSISTLACGGAHAIALTSVGKVFTWGRGTTRSVGPWRDAQQLTPKAGQFFAELCNYSCLSRMEPFWVCFRNRLAFYLRGWLIWPAWARGL